MKLPAAMFKNVDTHWRARMFSADVIEAAQSNRSLWPDVANKIAGFDVNSQIGSEEWAQAGKTALFRSGTGALGLPQSLVGSVSEALGPLVFGKPPTSLKSLGVQLGRTAIGLVTDALSAIPVVGTIARSIGAIADVLLQLANAGPKSVQMFFPPQQDFSETVDEQIMNFNLLPVLQTGDWTNVFMPRMATNVFVERQEGDSWALKSGGSSDGVGFIPGSRQISDMMQVTTFRPNSRASVIPSHRDTGDFYPGAARLGFSISEQVQTPSGFLYSVDVERILSAWTDLIESVFDLANGIWNGKNLGGTGLSQAGEEDRHRIIQSLVAPLLVVKFKGEYHRGMLGATMWSPGAKTETIVDAYVRPWVKQMRKRQTHYLGTTVCALVSSDGGAFKGNPRLDEERVAMQRLLLKSPAVKQVVQADIVDPEYRKEVWMKNQGGTLVAPGFGQASATAAKHWKLVLPPTTSEGYAPDPEAPQPEPPKGPVAFERTGQESKSMMAGLAALGLLGAAGVGVAAARRSKRRKN